MDNLLLVIATVTGWVSLLLGIVLLRPLYRRAGKAHAGRVTQSGAVAATPAYGNQPSVSCDLTGAERPCMTVRICPALPVLHVYTPSKATADYLLSLGPVIRRMETGENVDADDWTAVSRTAVQILSHNRECLSMADIYPHMSHDRSVVFLSDYLGWLSDLISSKN